MVNVALILLENLSVIVEFRKQKTFVSCQKAGWEREKKKDNRENCVNKCERLQKFQRKRGHCKTEEVELYFSLKPST